MREILNRDFSHPDDGWYMIEPTGDHPNKAGGVIQVIDGQAIASIVNRFNSDALAGKLSHGGEMLIDHEHFKHDQTKETRAYGWLQELQNRADGIYGRIHWTGVGRAAVDAGEYRFFSTEYAPADLQIINRGDSSRVRPLRLDGLTLTNQPNNKGGKPITNREAGQGEASGKLSPQQAGNEFVIVCNRLKAERKCSFSEAWNIAREQEPGMFAAMSGVEAHAVSRPAGTLQNRDCKRATDCILELAQDRQRIHGIPFERAWGDVQREFPDLSAQMGGRVLNRSGSAPETVSEGDWKSANKRAAEVMADLQNVITTPPDRGITATLDIPLRGTFKRVLKQLQADEGMTFEQAFNHIKETEPVFWSRVVLAYDLSE